MEADFKTHSACLISGSNDLRPLRGYEKHYLVKSHPVGFVFCSRIPTPNELITHYEKYPRYVYISPITIQRFHELLDSFEKYRKTGRIIDIGCGVGGFLIEAQKRGWEVHGTEYTDKAIEICEANNIKMKQGALKPDWYAPDSFDIVTSFEVIEHINNPIEEVQNIRKILRPGGLFYFTTPNFNAIERLYLKADYNVIEYPEHLSYYTKSTIHYLLSRNGFKKKKLVTTGISITRLKAGTKKNFAETYANSENTDEKVREMFERNRFTGFMKSSINWVLNLFGVGSAMKGWYEKK